MKHFTIGLIATILSTTVWAGGNNLKIINNTSSDLSFDYKICHDIERDMETCDHWSNAQLTLEPSAEFNTTLPEYYVCNRWTVCIASHYTNSLAHHQTLQMTPGTDETLYPGYILNSCTDTIGTEVNGAPDGIYGTLVFEEFDMTASYDRHEDAASGTVYCRVQQA